MLEVTGIKKFTAKKTKQFFLFSGLDSKRFFELFRKSLF